MRQPISRLRGVLEMDPARRILVVEGPHDLGFWRRVIPTSEQCRLVVRPVQTIDVGAAGGDRDRVIAVARALGPTGKVLGFVDADWSRVCGVGFGPHVVATDYRDREGYYRAAESLEVLCSVAKCKPPGDGTHIQNKALRICRPLAVLRVASEKNGLRLPFGKLLSEDDDKAYRRLWDRRTEQLVFATL